MIDQHRPANADTTPRSACYGDLRFTSTDQRDIAEAITICGTCTFRPCVDLLLEARQSEDRTTWQMLEGVYDGAYYSENSTGKRRRGSKGSAERVAPIRPSCGTEKGYQWHRQQKFPVWPLPKSDECGCRLAHREYERVLAEKRKKRAA